VRTCPRYKTPHGTTFHLHHHRNEDVLSTVITLHVAGEPVSVHRLAKDLKDCLHPVVVTDADAGNQAIFAVNEAMGHDLEANKA
jgi:hypothetical protein